MNYPGRLSSPLMPSLLCLYIALAPPHLKAEDEIILLIELYARFSRKIARFSRRNARFSRKMRPGSLGLV